MNQEILIIVKLLLTKDLHYQCGAELDIKLTVIMKYSMGNLPSSALTPIFEDVFFTAGIRTLRTGSNTKNRVRQVTTTFSGEYAIFILSDCQRY